MPCPYQDREGEVRNDEILNQVQDDEQRERGSEKSEPLALGPGFGV